MSLCLTASAAYSDLKAMILLHHLSAIIVIIIIIIVIIATVARWGANWKC